MYASSVVWNPLSNALRRLRGVDGLRDRWRRDLDAAERRLVSRADQALQRTSERARDAQRAQQARIKQLQLRVEELQRDLTSTAERAEDADRRAHVLEAVIAHDRRNTAHLSGFLSAVESGALRDHVTRALLAAPLIDDPAPMLVVRDLFPADVYNAVLEGIPPVGVFTRKDQTKYDFRPRASAALLSALAEQVWTYLECELIPKTMVPAIAARLGPALDAYTRDTFGPVLGEAVGELALEATSARLMLRKPGYSLRPHLDPRRVFATGLLYFARPGDDESFGTSFYRVEGQVRRLDTGTYFPGLNGHPCEFVRKIPFTPNSAVFFVNAAAHGVDIPAAAPPVVERYSLQFYLGPPVEPLKGLLRGLPEEERATWAELLA